MGSCLSTIFTPSRRMPSASESAAGTYLPPSEAENGMFPLRKADTSNGSNVKANIHVSLVNDDGNHPRSNLGTSNDASVNARTHPVSTQNQGDKKEVASFKRRALLIGITYTGPHNKWTPLDGPHDDVDRYQGVLTTTYGYRPEDIVVLKDLPELPEHRQPTRVNVIRELKALVAGAAAGDRLTFLFSGHSDQQDATSDLAEEDGMDELIITSDEQSVIDNELREIFDPLPVGSSLLAVLDTCHSGTLLDLPHYHCNSVYVPWQSKGERRTMTMQNANVRHQATGFANSTSQTIESQIEGQGKWFPDQPSNELPQIDTQLGRRRSVDQSELSPSRKRDNRRGRELVRTIIESQPRYASPEATFACDGWCKYSDVQYANVLSLSACSDMQRAWEGPRGSLTTVLCNYLKNNSAPSYGALMSHINFQLHDNALALHEYTRDQRKRAHRGQGEGFDGELDTFQEPNLSSLVKLNMENTLKL